MNVLIIGYGNLGQAIANVFSKKAFIQKLTIVATKPHATTDQKINFVTTPELVTASPDVIIIAVKPQVLKDVLPLYKKFAQSLFISLAAATPIATLQKYLGAKAVVARIMPNMAISLGASATLGFIPCEQQIISDTISLASNQELINQLFADTGKLLWLPSEEQLDNLTLIFSSGLAYFFSMTENLANIAKQYGLDTQKALELAKQTLLGSALLLNEDNLTPDEASKKIMSKGGVTAVAMEKLREPLQKLLQEAIAAGIKRMRELQ